MTGGARVERGQLGDATGSRRSTVAVDENTNEDSGGQYDRCSRLIVSQPRGRVALIARIEDGRAKRKMTCLLSEVLDLCVSSYPSLAQQQYTCAVSPRCTLCALLRLLPFVR